MRKLDKVVELVGGGYVIIKATLSSLLYWNKMNLIINLLVVSVVT